MVELYVNYHFNKDVKKGFKKNNCLTMTRREEDRTKDANAFLEDENPGEAEQGKCWQPIYSTKPQKTNDLVDLIRKRLEVPRYKHLKIFLKSFFQQVGVEGGWKGILSIIL